MPLTVSSTVMPNGKTAILHYDEAGLKSLVGILTKLEGMNLSLNPVDLTTIAECPRYYLNSTNELNRFQADLATMKFQHAHALIKDIRGEARHQKPESAVKNIIKSVNSYLIDPQASEEQNGCAASPAEPVDKPIDKSAPRYLMFRGFLKQELDKTPAAKIKVLVVYDTHERKAIGSSYYPEEGKPSSHDMKESYDETCGGVPERGQLAKNLEDYLATYIYFPTPEPVIKIGDDYRFYLFGSVPMEGPPKWNVKLQVRDHANNVCQIGSTTEQTWFQREAEHKAFRVFRDGSKLSESAYHFTLAAGLVIEALAEPAN